MKSVLHRITMKRVKSKLPFKSLFSQECFMCHPIKFRKWTGSKYSEEYLRFSKGQHLIITAAGLTAFLT